MSLCRKMFGKRLKELRKSKNLTQEQLAELVGFEPNHLTKIESGKHFPQPEKLDSIAKVFDIQIKDLFDYEHKLPEQILKNKITNWLEEAQTPEIEYIYKTIQNLKEYKKFVKKY
ncbi:helix-turn-helix transcriptional regulator [bacterium]|nr:helix-turn-helix transcriptional regulator [bacterium]